MTAEHILELNTIGRFLQAGVDRKLNAAPAGKVPGRMFIQVPLDVVNLFADRFRSWPYPNVSPAELALSHCGSTSFTYGMVVADKILNGIKMSLYQLNQPMQEDKWKKW